MRWLLVGGTAVGTAHLAAALPCQDSVAWWACAEGPDPEPSGAVAVAALADGAGSARLSDVGARTSVEEVVRQARALPGHGPCVAQDPGEGHCRDSGSSAPEDADGDEEEAVRQARMLFAGARQALCAEARRQEVTVSELATTLAVVLVTARAVVVGQIGDGILAVRLRSGEIIGPVSPQRGEFANETTFLTTGDDLPSIALACFAADEVDAFGLSSDGLRLLITSDPATGAPHAPFFEDVFSGVAGGVGGGVLARFLADADDRTGDDKSLVVGVRVG